MLNQKQSEIAVRLYDNNAYGTTYGKGLYRKAIYNGTIDAKSEGIKYLVDLYIYAEWANMAKTDEQIEILANVEAQSNALYSWVKHYDENTKDKITVPGMCRLNTESMTMYVFICDEAHGMTDTWELTTKHCRQSRAGIKTPQLLATNADLRSW